MPSIAVQQWQNDRVARLNEVEAHCTLVAALIPPKPAFLDETLRGFVLHLSAHFQGFCRDLYTEASQVCIALMPPGLHATAQLQFLGHLAMETGNPSHVNLKRDFGRFGFALSLHATNAAEVTALGHLNAWRNKAAHQGTRPLPSGVPGAISLATVQGWKSSCDRLASALDGIMQIELQRITGSPPW